MRTMDVDEVLAMLKQTPELVLQNEKGQLAAYVLSRERYAYLATVQGTKDTYKQITHKETRGERKKRARARQRQQETLEREQRRGRHLTHERNRQAKLQRKMIPRNRLWTGGTVGTPNISFGRIR